RPQRLVDTCGLEQPQARSEEHTSELQSLTNLVCRLLLEKKKKEKPNASSEYKQDIGRMALAEGNAKPDDYNGETVRDQMRPTSAIAPRRPCNPHAPRLTLSSRLVRSLDARPSLVCGPRLSVTVLHTWAPLPSLLCLPLMSTSSSSCASSHLPLVLFFFFKNNGPPPNLHFFPYTPLSR